MRQVALVSPSRHFPCSILGLHKLLMYDYSPSSREFPQAVKHDGEKSRFGPLQKSIPSFLSLSGLEESRA